jgi:KipI family sensor histidine kinase inhibitor
MITSPRVSLLGTTALLFEAPGEAVLESQQRIWALAWVAANWSEIQEAVPGVNSLMLTFASPPRDLAPLRARLLAAWADAEPMPLHGRVIELPIVYGGDGGPHLADVIAHTGLSVDELVDRHTAPVYPVYAIGSHPGYCYLGGMDERIATPRRKVPVLRIPAGSVSIGGKQTGVSASPGPSGWNTIGFTSSCFFDPVRSRPTLLEPGDAIRFRAEKVIR